MSLLQLIPLDWKDEFGTKKQPSADHFTPKQLFKQPESSFDDLIDHTERLSSDSESQVNKIVVMRAGGGAEN